MPADPDDDLRVSDAERRSVVDRLTVAVGDGLLTLDEFADHAGGAYAARTRAELEAVTRDLRLPVPTTASVPVTRRLPEPASPDAGPVTKRRWIVAIMGGEERKGRWRASRRLGAFALMGGVELDLREALLEDDIVEITAWAIMGGVTVIVPEGIAVESEGFMLMGGRSNRVKGTPLPSSPVVRVKGYGMWGGVEVKSRRPGHTGYDDDDSVRYPHLPPPPIPAIPPLPPFPQHSHRQHQQQQQWQQRQQRQQQRQEQRQQERNDRTDRVRQGAPSGGAPSPAAAAPAPVPGGVVTIVCTDIVGSTRLADTLGDQRYRDLVGAHNAIVRGQLARHAGTEVKNTGDGFLVTFASARSAVAFALDLHEAVRSLDLQLRIGVHAGEVERDGSDIVGRNVSLACRLCDSATPGEVLASAMVADLTDSSSDLAFGDDRELQLAGIDRPIHARPASRR